MRKLSCKWPVWMTLFAFSMPIFYVFFRAGHPKIFNADELLGKVFAAVFFTVIIWLVYGIACLFAPSRTVVIKGQKVPKNCGNCKFSEKTTQTSMDGVPDPEEMKCNLTGYDYTTDYTCKKWEGKQAEQAKDSQSGNR